MSEDRAADAPAAPGASAAPTGSALPPLGYQPSLDGIRALAIGLVVLFHTDRGGHLPVLAGGFLGVDVFFVLSGFLITSLMLDEHAGAGRIRLGAFWGRRVARLFPLLWALLAFNALAELRPIAGVHPPSPLGFLAVLGYVGNWLPALGHNGLFGLEYVWSLSVEEQFYVVWPLAVTGLLLLVAGRRSPAAASPPPAPDAPSPATMPAPAVRTPRAVGGSSPTVALVALVAAVAVMVLRATVFRHTYFFFNTLLRCDGLLLGAALAGSRRWWQPRIKAAGAPLAAVLSVAALVAIGVVTAGTGNLDPSLPTWKLPTVEVAVVVLAAALVATPGTALVRAAGCRPLVWLGRRSYALYLVHLPLFDILEAHLGADRPRLRAVVEIPLALLLAHLAHVLWELPVQRRLRRLLRAEHKPADHATAPERALAV